jgi:AmmeMemoRadiSam system protein B
VVQDYLAEAKVANDLNPKAVIAPHAGYIYSGPIAGSAFAPLASRSAEIRRIVLLGPAHRVAFSGLALSSAEAFVTPLGPVVLDKPGAQLVMALPQVRILNEAHAYEHSLEVELPFLQVILKQFQLVPLVVGDATSAEVAEVVDRIWGGPETRFVISSDLSHYLDYAAACKVDRATARAIEALDDQAIEEHHACGHTPVRGLLCAARRHRLTAHTVDLRNSGDTAGARDRVVGYGAFVFTEAPS